MIHEIRYQNFKGQTGEQKLTGRDIFIGLNGVGKTLRIQALGLGMLGYVPGQGKTAAETFKLATGEEMSVGLTADGELTRGKFSFDRTFGRTEKRSRKTGEVTISINESITTSPGQGERNDTQKRNRIMVEIGNFPVMMDFGEFLSLSDAKRRDFFYSLSPISSEKWGRGQIEEHLRKNLLSPELQENNPDQYQAMEEIIAKAMEKFPENYGVSEGLQSMIDWTKTQLSFWKGKKADSQGAVRQLAELKNQLADTDRNILEQKEELEKLREQLVQVEKQISQDTEKKRAIDQRTARIDELNRLIAEVENQPVNTDTADLDKKIDELRAQMVEDNKDQEIAEWKTKRAKYAQKINEYKATLEKLREKRTEVRLGMDNLEKSLVTATKLGGTCVINKNISCPKDFSKFEVFVKETKVKADQALAAIQEKINKASDQLKVFESQHQTAESAIERLLKESQEAAAKNRDLQAGINQLEKERNERLNAQEKKDNLLKMYQDELSRLMNTPAEPIGDIEIMQKQAEGIRNRISTLKDSVQEKEKARNTIMTMQQSSIENQQAIIKTACLKSLDEELGPKGIQGELVKEILDPVKDDIRNNLKSMGFDHEPYFQTESDTGKEVFQFGWINEKGHCVNFDALSTGQQTVFLAAMMITIIDRANPVTRILAMDNINHLDKRNFQMLVNGLDQVADKLDNIILAGAIEFNFVAPESWTVWNLSGVQEVSKSA